MRCGEVALARAIRIEEGEGRRMKMTMMRRVAREALEASKVMRAELSEREKVDEREKVKRKAEVVDGREGSRLSDQRELTSKRRERLCSRHVKSMPRNSPESLEPTVVRPIDDVHRPSEILSRGPPTAIPRQKFW